jgi:tetratricopeptide (TPR) repeat protein
MQKNKTLFIVLLILISNINKSISQELVIDPMYRIQLLLQLENYDSAIEFTKKLDDSLKCEKNEILGFSYGKLGKHKIAAKYYKNYIKDCKASSIQRINLGDNYFKSKQFNKAKKQFLKVNFDDPNYSLAQYNIGMIEYETGNKENAVKYFTSAINKTKGETLDFDYVEMQIKALNEIKEYDTAFKNIDVVLEIWDKNSIEYKYTLIIKSSIFGAKEEYKTAIEILENIIKSGIDNKIVLLEAYSYQLEFYSKLKKTKKACEIYQKIKVINPETEVLKEYKCE